MLNICARDAISCVKNNVAGVKVCGCLGKQQPHPLGERSIDNNSCTLRCQFAIKDIYLCMEQIGTVQVHVCNHAFQPNSQNF
jgi:hypothetical protein